MCIPAGCFRKVRAPRATALIAAFDRFAQIYPDWQALRATTIAIIDEHPEFIERYSTIHAFVEFARNGLPIRREIANDYALPSLVSTLRHELELQKDTLTDHAKRAAELYRNEGK